jgi:peptidoglycan/LPS O-acetylase OafA/YrhL
MTVESRETASDRFNPAPPAKRCEAHTRRIGALDSIRGIAILFVLVGHYLPFNLVQGSAALILSPFAQGGVILFFLLSGFLIDNNLARDGNLARYSLHRVFRIIPAYWVALAVILVFEGFITRERLFSAREVAINALLLNDIILAALMSGVFWTLLIESRFYIAAPVVKRLGERATFLLPFALVLLNLAVLATRHQSSNLLTYITYCFVGMQFSLWRRGEISLPQLAVVIVLVAPQPRSSSTTTRPASPCWRWSISPCSGGL